MADVITAAQKVRWDLAGISGGIPPPGTIYTTLTATGDSTDRYDDIVTALWLCPPGQRVLLGPGMFFISSGAVLKIPSGKELCGSGKGVTIWYDTRTYGGACIDLGDGAQDYPYDPSGTSITADAAKGDTVLPMSGGAGGWVVGDIAVITQEGPDDVADPALVEFNVNGGKDRLRRQYVEVASVAAYSITITVPLYWDLELARSPVAHCMQRGFYVGSGLRNLTVDCTGGTVARGVDMFGCVRSYLDSVEVKSPTSYGVYLLSSFQCEIFGCDIDLNYGTGGSNSSGILVERSSAFRIVNNAIVRCFPSIEINFGCSGWVVAYNFLDDTTTYGVQGGSLNTNHGPHNSFGLVEGNCAPNLWCDGYFGSASEVTIVRNRLHGTNENSPTGAAKYTTSRCLDLNRFARKMAVAGNVLGMTQAWWSTTHGRTMIKEPSTSNYGSTNPVIYKLGYPNLGNEGFTGTASLINGDPWTDWPAGTGTGNFQERDLDVIETMLRKGNWNGYDDAIHASEALAGGETVENSYYLSAKPSWFGALAWPPVDSTSPILDPVDAAKAIPAGYRYYMGANPPESSVSYAFSPSIARCGFGFGGFSPL